MIIIDALYTVIAIHTNMCGRGINNLHVPGCAQDVSNTVYVHSGNLCSLINVKGGVMILCCHLVRLVEHALFAIRRHDVSYTKTSIAII